MAIGGREGEKGQVEMTLMPIKTVALPPTNALGHPLLWAEIVTGVIRAPSYLECAMTHAIYCANPTCCALILPKGGRLRELDFATAVALTTHRVLECSKKGVVAPLLFITSTLCCNRTRCRLEASLQSQVCPSVLAPRPLALIAGRARRGHGAPGNKRRGDDGELLQYLHPPPRAASSPTLREHGVQEARSLRPGTPGMDSSIPCLP
jgi:hypothetical protein